jgi:uncharacterized protein YyaL (SSP411 family)
MLSTVRDRWFPNQVVLLRPDPQPAGGITGLAPWVEDHRAVDDAATAYVCRDRVCDLPVTDVTTLSARLKQP